jgi:PKD repeat protein
MRAQRTLTRLLLIALISPALLGTYFKCVAVSNPTIATARIDQVEPLTLRVGDLMQVTGSGNGAPPLQFAWEFGDGATAGGMQASHVYASPGSYRITLLVRDADGHTATDSSQVNVAGRLSASALNLVVASEAIAGRPIVFEALSAEREPGARTYRWTFSDGQMAIGAQASATFPVEGMYLAIVTVTDDLGAVAAEQIAFHVMGATN